MTGPLTTNEQAWGLRVASAGQIPASYPSLVSFSAPRADAVWWAFRQSTSGVSSAYVAWTNGRTVVIRARQLLEQDNSLSDAASYDGRAAGPMGPAFQAQIDDAMLRRMWAWLARARREGRMVVTQSLLDQVAASARSRTLSDAVAAAMILVGWHTGGLTGASFPSLMSAGEFFLIMKSGTLPRYGESMLGADAATAFQGVALVNNLDNLPRSGIPQLDAWRTQVSTAPVLPPISVTQPGSSPGVPATSAPTSSSPARPSPMVGGFSDPTTIGGSSWNPSAPRVEFGAPVISTPPSTSSPSLPVAPGTSSLAQRPESASPGSSPSSPASPSQPGSSNNGVAPAMLAGSLAEVAKKSWPYLLGGVAVVGSGFLVYHFVTKED